jgi:ADP-ribosylglycohydrolase
MMCVGVETSDRERAIVGSLLGTAVGDAIGLPYEGLSPRRASRLLGSPNRHRFFFGRGMISDDTEHACLVAEALIADPTGNDFASELARRLRTWIRLVPAGVGFATLRACLKLNLGITPPRSGVYSAGNGPAMRSAIIGAAVDDMERLRSLIRVSTCITHTDPRAEQGALAVALAARRAAARQQLAPRECIAEIETLCELEASRELVQLLRQAASSAEGGESTKEFAKLIGLERGVSGYVNHTVPIVLHACWTHSNDFRAAVQSVILCGGDADTTAAIVGGIIGAQVGKDGIPAEWLEGLRDWPRSSLWIEDLGKCLAGANESGAVCAPPRATTVALLPRNALFAAVVLFHGFRRLLPPY